MGYPLVILVLSHVRGVCLRPYFTTPSVPETTQEKRAILPHALIYLDLRCHLPCIFPLACQLPPSSDCGPPFFFPRNVDEIPTFDESQPANQALSPRHFHRECTRDRASRRVPRSAGCAFRSPRCMLFAAGSGRWVLWVPHHSEHVCGRSRCSSGVEGRIVRDTKLGGRAAAAPCYHGILILGGPC